MNRILSNRLFLIALASIANQICHADPSTAASATLPTSNPKVASVPQTHFKDTTSGPSGWYGENIEGPTDLAMMDVRWPWFSAGIYTAQWNVTVDRFYFYGGVAAGSAFINSLADTVTSAQDGVRGAGPWSFWGSNAKGEVPICIEGSPGAYLDYVPGGHEGSSLNCGGDYPFVRRNAWFTTLTRVWTPEDSAQDCAFVGRWMKDVEAGHWHSLGVVRLPSRGASFKTNAGFIEKFRGGWTIAALDRRLGYYRKNGKWVSSDTISLGNSTDWAWQPKEENGIGYLAMELVSGKGAERKTIRLPDEAILPQNLACSITIPQPAEPVLDRPVIASASATSDGKQVAVQWELNEKSSPQLQWRIEVFDNPKCEGEPIAVKQDRMPQTRFARLDAQAANPGIRVTIHDIFDQASAAVEAQVTQVNTVASAVKPPASLIGGLTYHLVAKDAPHPANILFPAGLDSDQSRKEQHFWTSLADIDTAAPVCKGHCNGLDLSPAQARKNGYAFTYEGYLEIPQTGIYLFHMLASDGYRLQLDGHEVVAWNTPRGTMGRSGSAVLQKGLHAFSLSYYVDRSPYLKLSWEGPGIEKQEIPASAYHCADSAESPKISLIREGAALRVNTEDRGHAIKSLDLYDGRLRLASAQAPSLRYDGPLFSGKNTLFARCTYDSGDTTDTPLILMDGPSETFTDGWTLKCLTSDSAPRGITQKGKDAFAMIGDGEYLVGKKMLGDFTLTCRVDAFTTKKDEPVSHKAQVGLAVGNKDLFSIFQTSAYGLRTTTDFNDWSGMGISASELPAGRPWLRLTRLGSTFAAWTSVDGKIWEQVAQRDIPCDKEQQVGVLYRDMALAASNWFKAQVSSVELRAGIAPESSLSSSIPATGSDKALFTGVVCSPAHPQTVILRSPTKGLFKTTDGGKTWAEINAGLPAEANAVRSVALDPKDDRVIYRAAGLMENHVWKGGLWKTTDGGASWSKLSFPGDFDGTGPSTLCGEVIAFADSQGANAVRAMMVGSESRGLFMSLDEGKTWSPPDHVSMRFTSLTAKDGGSLVAVTCPDSFMHLLGRGQPAISTTEKVAHCYEESLTDKGARKEATHEARTDTGYLRVFCDRGNRIFCTTQGLESTFMHGGRTFLLMDRGQVESHRPATAFLLPSKQHPAFFQPLSPKVPGKFSFSSVIASPWLSSQPKGDVPQGGSIAFADAEEVKEAWLVTTDGVYRIEASGAFKRIDPLHPTP